MAAAARSEVPVEIIDLRHFTSAEMRPLLELETQAWGRLLAWDYRSSAEMILRYIDAKILPGYAATDSRGIRGYSFFVYEGAKGVIGDLFVANGGDPAVTGGLEQRLLTHVIETLQRSPGVHRIESQLLVHGTGAVARPFQQTGFLRHPRLFMVLPVGNGRAVRPSTPANLEIRPWEEHDFQAAASVITAAYRGHIDSEINDQYRSLGGSLRFLNNIVRFPGCGFFDAESSFVALDRVSRATVGVLLCSRVRDDVGHVTQVCVVPELRGKGLGEALIAACVGNLARRQFSKLSLTVTEANTRAVKLYERLGFETKRVFDAFVWEG
jgi:ribosomal protein S18 acetylase RimI-like enzyme